MFYRAKHVHHDKKLIITLLTILAAVLLLAAYPFTEPYLLDIDQFTLTGTSLPAGIGQMKVVYLSDIHEGSGPYSSHSRTVDLVRTINSLHADLVLLGGDYASDSEGAIRFFENLPKITASYGVYGVVGNHDRTLPESNLSRLRTAMYNAGVTPLVNDTASVRIGSSNVIIAGIDDAGNGAPMLGQVAASVKQDDYVIFLSHTPAVIPAALTAKDADGHRGWYDLGLFGHTHGGQVAWLGSLLMNTGVDARYEHGWITENRIPMLISNGVGTTGLPVRFLRRPQVHLITLRSGT